MLYPKLKFAQFAAAGSLIAAIFNMGLGPLLGAILDRLDSDYRYTFLASSLLAALALGLSRSVARRWQQCGGNTTYTAPE